MKHWTLLFGCALLGLAACRSTSPTPPLATPPAASGVYVVNEGGFAGGGGMTFYDLVADTAYQDAVAGATGWVFPNDIAIVGARGYVAVNGADKLDVLDALTRHVVRSIAFPAGSGPGFLAVAGDTLYVANYDGTVSFVDLRTDSLVGTVGPVVGFPGGIATAGGKVFISDIGRYPVAGRLVKVLRPGSPVVIDSIGVGSAPGPLVALGGGLFVACTGSSTVYHVNQGTLALVDSLQLSAYIADCATDGEYLYVLGSDSVAKVEDTPLSLISSALIRRAEGSYFYALSVMRPEGVLYVSNIMSPGGAGRIESYHADGSQARPPFPAGVFPGAFGFRH